MDGGTTPFGQDLIGMHDDAMKLITVGADANSTTRGPNDEKAQDHLDIGYVWPWCALNEKCNPLTCIDITSITSSPAVGSISRRFRQPSKCVHHPFHSANFP
jgi:hypothetical protein